MATSNFEVVEVGNIVQVDGAFITEEDFWNYEAVRLSGMTNMLNREAVCNLADLNSEQYYALISNYSQIRNYFGDNSEEE